MRCIRMTLLLLILLLLIQNGNEIICAKLFVDMPQGDRNYMQRVQMLRRDTSILCEVV